jgi:hypothetical protein
MSEQRRQKFYSRDEFNALPDANAKLQTPDKARLRSTAQFDPNLIVAQ